MDLDDWNKSWRALMTFPGPTVPKVEERIADIVKLWVAGAPPEGPRMTPDDGKWTAGPYRRGDAANPSPEHKIELEILGDGVNFAEGPTCFGGRVIAGANAIPLLTSVPGQKLSRMEADLLLLVDHGGGQRLYLAEAKSESNHPWYAAVELLQQMQLFFAMPYARDLFHRCETDVLAGLPLTGLVLAPPAFYKAAGRKSADVVPTQDLLEAVGEQCRLDVRLATWNGKAIAPFTGAAPT